MRPLMLLVLAACANPKGEIEPAGLPEDTAAPTVDPTGTDDTCADALPARREADPAAADRGRDLFIDGTLGGAMVPTVGLRNLWAVWGGGPIPDDAVYWAAFRERYGLIEAPWPNDDLPLGLHQVDATWSTVNCLLCHADVVAGETVIGVGNSRIDLQALWDDLVELNAVAAVVGLPPFPLPYTLEDRTGSAGTVDGVGLGMQMSLLYGPPGVAIETRFGVQQAAPWWTMPLKDRVYSDGTGDVDNHRTMASTLLAFGTSWSELQALDATLLDLQAMMFDTSPPPWPYDLDEALVADGREVYRANCAGCHGDLCDPDVGYPDRVIPTADIGTDPTREQAWTDAEAAWANISWFGDPGPMRDTDGYQANPLKGVWASAPYLHNGSVPDLAALLDPASRPQVWQRTGASATDYDPERVGWRFTTPRAPADRSTPEARRVVDTTQPGAAATGHDIPLSPDDRDAVLEYLKTL
jgi:mono/diheme cytochrome c family protein